MSKSNIEWTEKTWNPTTGCDKVSAGCTNCYAETMSRRLKAMRNRKYQNGFETTEHPVTLSEPLKWKKKPALVFVNSMSDLFHKDVTDTFILDVLKTIKQTLQHTYQILTKRSERLSEFEKKHLPNGWPDNVWLGVSVENDKVLYRIDDLKQTSARIKWLSIEPLLGPLPNLDLTDIDWVVVGCESGPKSRPMQEEWVQDILQLCKASGVPFFFKQWGGKNKKKAGRLLNGRTYDEMPEIINN